MLVTRLTNAFSKKLENLEHAVALHFFAYNFITRHGTLRMPSALKAGVTDHVWTFEELVELIDRGGADGVTADCHSPLRFLRPWTLIPGRRLPTRPCRARLPLGG